MQPASVAVATDLSADSQGTPSPIPDPERSRSRALLIACLTVAIERFAFYVVFSLYTLFLGQQYHLTDAQATTQYGVLIGAVYFTPFFGGAISDRFGASRSICVGILLLIVAYVGFSAGLSLLICVTLLAAGMGLFKGNLTALVGSLFDTQAERDTAYSRFYWSVNLGSLPAGFVGGWLSQHYGYSAAFQSCAAATVVCLLVWWRARSLFPERVRRPPRPRSTTGHPSVTESLPSSRSSPSLHCSSVRSIRAAHRSLCLHGTTPDSPLRESPSVLRPTRVFRLHWYSD